MGRGALAQFFLAVSAVFLVSSQLAAQQVEGPIFRVHTDLVLLDTTVLDASGHPVTGLQKDDFLLLVDGQPQAISAFDAVESKPLPAAAQAPGAVLDVREPASFGAAPLTIFVIDEVNTHFPDTAYGKRNLAAYLEKQPRQLKQSAALFVLTDKGLELQQGFTADRDLLVGALNKTPVRNAWNLERSMSVGEGVADRLAASLTALEQIAHSVRSIPVHKTMIWLGAGFPSVDQTTLTPAVKKMLDADLEYVTNMLLEARISLNAVDPTSSATGLTEVTDASQLAFLSAAGDSSSTLSDPFDKSFDFDRLAPVSGGRVLRGRNDVGALVDRAVEAGARFYSLGYYLPHSQQGTPQFHKLEVRLKRAGFTVLSRQGYYSAVAEKALESRERVQADLNDAVATTLPMTDLRVRVEGNGGHYRLLVTSDKLSWKQEAGGGLTASVQIVVAGVTAKHAVVSPKVLSESAHARVGVDPEITPREVVFAVDFDRPEAATALRFVVRDAASGRMGTADLR